MDYIYIFPVGYMHYLSIKQYNIQVCYCRWFEMHHCYCIQSRLLLTKSSRLRQACIQSPYHLGLLFPFKI